MFNRKTQWSADKWWWKIIISCSHMKHQYCFNTMTNYVLITFHYWPHYWPHCWPTAGVSCLCGEGLAVKTISSRHKNTQNKLCASLPYGWETQNVVSLAMIIALFSGLSNRYVWPYLCLLTFTDSQNKQS